MEAKRLFYGSPNEIMEFIYSDEKAASIYEIANSIFMLEKIIKKNKKIPKQVLIYIYFNLNDIEIKKITKLLNILISDILLEDIFFIIKNKDFKKRKIDRKFKGCKTICLFSGGVDSTIGIIKSKQKYEDVIG